MPHNIVETDALAALPQETVRGQTTVEGSVLEIALDGGVTVDDTTVIQADVEADDGVVHVIDRVLIPAA
jgi:uncharacterized surface protein with fasciclin (FAS1) repeats